MFDLPNKILKKFGIGLSGSETRVQSPDNSIKRSKKDYAALAKIIENRADSKRIFLGKFNLSGNSLNTSAGNYLENLFRVIEDSFLHQQYSKDTSDSLSEQMLELKAGDFSSQNWLFIYNILFSAKYFIPAGIARKKALESVITRSSKNIHEPDALITIFKAYMDQSLFDEARDTLNKIKSIDPGNSHVKELEYYYCLGINEAEKAAEVSTEFITSENDSEYKDLIKNKSIAIVGPAYCNTANNEEIESYDLVIRFNYRGSGQLSNFEYAGSRTDISYYRLTDVRTLQLNNMLGVLDDLKFYVFNSFNNLDSFLPAGYLKSNKLRKSLYINTLFYGLPSASLKALTDIFVFSPSSVKLFNMNFWLSKNPYQAGYRNQNSNEFQELDNSGTVLLYDSKEIYNRLQVLAKHDVISQLNFVKNLYKSGLIKADDELSEILKLNTNDYLSRMQEIYT